jgi:hypothetical protein
MSKKTPTGAFIEGFPNGLVGIIKQTNGRYRIIVSRPPNKPDLVLSGAEAALIEILENDILSDKVKKELDLDGDDDE